MPKDKKINIASLERKAKKIREPIEKEVKKNFGIKKKKANIKIRIGFSFKLPPYPFED